MCKILLSINPEHVEKILNGKKQYEFRKVHCRENVDKIIMYATSPIMRIVGEAQVLEIIEDDPERVWALTAEFAGITKMFYDKYYRNREKAIAYRLGEVKKYKKPLKLEDFGINFVPQSIVYV